MNVTFELNGSLCGRWLLAILFVWAALGKLANPQEFHGNLLAYQLPLPDAMIRATAVVLPWLELLAGLLLISVPFRGPALIWAASLCVVFLLATCSAWLRGLRIDCGCFDPQVIGLSKDGTFARFISSSGFAFVRSVVLAAVALALLRVHYFRQAPQS